jgi:hypothetical protein
MTLFIDGEKTETLSQRSVTCSMPVMLAPCGGSATATGIVSKGKTEIKAMADARKRLFSLGTG